jgi:hypothetical protein
VEKDEEEDLKRMKLDDRIYVIKVYYELKIEIAKK